MAHNTQRPEQSSKCEFGVGCLRFLWSSVRASVEPRRKILPGKARIPLTSSLGMRVHSTDDKMLHLMVCSGQCQTWSQTENIICFIEIQRPACLVVKPGHETAKDTYGVHFNHDITTTPCRYYVKGAELTGWRGRTYVQVVRTRVRTLRPQIRGTPTRWLFQGTARHSI